MMHVILGDGEMAKRDLTSTLEDLRDKAAEEDDTFWVLVQGKAEPTNTDRALMAWVKDNQIYFEVISDGSEDETLYEGNQDRHVVKRLAPKVLSLMQSKPEDGEQADMLALFVSDDPEAEEDRWVNEVIQEINEQEFVTYALNDGLVEVKVGKQQPAKAPAKKAAAKKAAAAPRSAGPSEPDLATDEYTREQLGAFNLTQLKEIATARGIELPPRTRTGTYIDHILGEAKDGEPEVEVTPVEAVEEPEELPEEGEMVVSTTGISGPALLVIMANGTVYSRVVSADEAMALL